jgi:hypothetical protein
MALSFALTSITYSAEEALTPENLSGIWQGYGHLTGGFGIKSRVGCRRLITPTLSILFRCNSQGLNGRPEYDFDQGEIINNQLVVRDQEKPDIIRIKANINSKNALEGTIEIPRHFGDLVNFKKARALTEEEKQRPLSQLEGLVKY